MTRKTVSGICVGLVLASVSVWAQASGDGVRPASKLVTIYSTLGKGDNVYSTQSAIGILGTDTGQMLPEMVANGFRPKADHVVTEVQVGATHNQGTNVLVVSLNQDNHGVPGKALHTWRFSNLPAIWTCCTLQTGKYAKGIKVQKGKLYWVVLRPNQQFQDTWDFWADNFAGKQGRLWANNTGTGWNASYQTLAGLGVFGK
jgi:hypothetical protein